MRLTIFSILLATLLLVPGPASAKVIIEMPGPTVVPMATVVPDSTVVVPGTTIVTSTAIPFVPGARYYEETREWRPALFKPGRHKWIRHEISAFEAQRLMNEDPSAKVTIEYR